LLAGIGSGVAAACSPLGLAAAVFLALAAAGVVATIALPDRDREAILIAFVVALALRIFLMLILVGVYQTPDNPNAFIFRDSFGYHRVAADFADLLHDRVPFRVGYHATAGTLSYHQLVGYIYAAFGTSHWIPRVANCLFGALSVILTYSLVRPIAGRRPARIAAWMLALWPTAMFWSVQVLKDEPVAFLVLIGILCWVRLVSSGNALWLLAALAAVVPLYFMRFYICIFMLAGYYAGLLAIAIIRRRADLAIGLVALVVFGWSIPMTLGLIDDPQTLLLKMSLNDPTAAGSFLSAVAHGGLNVGLVVPLAMVKFMLSPLPWKAAGADNWVVPGIIAQYAILPAAVRGAWILLRDRVRYVLPIVVLTVLTNLIYALVFLGGNPRHMHMFYPFMFMCAAVGLQGWRHWALPWTLFFLVMIGGAMLMFLGPR
jgi:hypothetical protein